MFARSWYRCRQFASEIKARPLSPAAQAEVRLLLAEAEWQLFKRFTFSDQKHSYAVMQTLRAAGQEEPALLKAALLHDVGKTQVPIYLWERVAIVLAKALAPRWAQRWGQGEPAGWRRPFVIKAKHPEWGAQMAAAAGSPPEVVSLIRHHQDPLDQTFDAGLAQALRQLQWADEQH